MQSRSRARLEGPSSLSVEVGGSQSMERNRWTARRWAWNRELDRKWHSSCQPGCSFSRAGRARKRPRGRRAGVAGCWLWLWLWLGARVFALQIVAPSRGAAYSNNVNLDGNTLGLAALEIARSLPASGGECVAFARHAVGAAPASNPIALPSAPFRLRSSTLWATTPTAFCTSSLLPPR